MRLIAVSTKISTLLFLVLFSTPTLAQIVLNMGVYTTDQPSVVVKVFKPVLTQLESDLSIRLNEPVKIRIQVANSYAKGIEAIATGAVDISRIGPASYVELTEREPGITILAIESKKGRKQFNGVICVHRDSPIERVDDLRGKRFAFGDEGSTIGRYLSQNYLQQYGINAKNLAHYEYLGRHDRVAYAVAAGKFDAGALKESTYKRLVKKGVPLRVIAELPNVTKPWVARAGLDSELVAMLSASMVTLQKPELLRSLGVDGFLEGSDTDYGRIRDAIVSNVDFFE